LENVEWRRFFWTTLYSYAEEIADADRVRLSTLMPYVNSMQYTCSVNYLKFTLATL